MQQQMTRWMVLASIAVGLGLTSPAHASSRAGTLKGEKIEHIALAKGRLAEEARSVLGGGTIELGFKYSYLLRQAPIWTWDGNFVLYNSAGGNTKQYIVLTDDQIKELHGGTIPSKPFLYRFPVGLILFPLMIAIGLGYYFVVRPIKARRRAKGVAAASADPRYARALAMTAPVTYRDEDGDLVTAPKHSAMDAVNWLVAQGIPREEAQATYSALEDQRDARQG